MTTLPSNRYRQRDPGVPRDTVVLGRNRQKERLPGWQPINLKFFGPSCIDCNKVLEVGERVLWHSHTKKIRCLECATT